MIWNLGLPKTATVSLNMAMWKLGLRVCHSDPSINERLAKERPQDWKALQRIFAGFQGGNEMPQVRNNYGLIDQLDPNPKFIFTHRDCKTWMESMHRHKATNSERRLWPIFLNPSGWEEHYHQHTNAVLSYFEGRDDFLFMDIFDGDGWDLLAMFLNKERPENWAFPHENKGAKLPPDYEVTA